MVICRSYPALPAMLVLGKPPATSEEPRIKLLTRHCGGSEEGHENKHAASRRSSLVYDDIMGVELRSRLWMARLTGMISYNTASLVKGTRARREA